MSGWLRLGIGRHILPSPEFLWRRQITRNARGIQSALGFMSAEHHRVRNFAVLELPRTGAALAPERIATALQLPVQRVVTILDDLERHLTFLYRDPAGAVAWAYPVTVDRTPHRVTLSTGEQTYAA